MSYWLPGNISAKLFFVITSILLILMEKNQKEFSNSHLFGCDINMYQINFSWRQLTAKHQTF